MAENGGIYLGGTAMLVDDVWEEFFEEEDQLAHETLIGVEFL